MGLEKLYDMAPIWVQNLMCSVKGWQIVRRRYGKGFYSELDALENGAYAPQKELEVFLETSKQVPYYSGLFTANKDKSGTELLRLFPILTKTDVKTHLNEMVNKQCTEPQFMMRTSGTTGGGLVFPYTVRMENKHWAVWWRYRRRLGINLDTWCGWFGGKRMIDPNNKRPPFWRINKPGRQIMYSSLHLTPDTVAFFYKDIKERKLPWLHGYPSHIAKFAALALDRGLGPLTDVKWVTTGAENLVGNQVLLMEKMFPNALIRQHYGLMEGVANISQDKEGKWYVDEDFAYVEFIPLENRPDKTTTDYVRCKIIGTGFSNPAFPLIRYDTGDIAEVVWKDVEGKRVLEVVKIEGRSSNIVKGPDGFEINEARLSIILHDFNSIVEAQFVQHSLTDIELKIVKSSSYCEGDEKQLKKNIAECFDQRMNVRLVYVDESDRTKSGKLKLVVSEL